MRFATHAILVTLPALLILASSAATCLAGFTFLGPTPYLSAADSPFAEHLDGPDFYLEDFEDGELNTPGIFEPTQPFPIFNSWHGVALPPGEETDSVDGDDGAIDGHGNAGFSFRSGAHIVNPMIPPRNEIFFRFSFDEELLGSLPNRFGFVWTDGPAGIEFGNGFGLAMIVTDSQGVKSVSDDYRLPGNGLRNGDTSEDVFLGVQNMSGIQDVVVNAVFFGEVGGFEYFEIDHVQYGHIVPEPRGIECFVMLLLVFLSLGGRSLFRRCREVGNIVI